MSVLGLILLIVAIGVILFLINAYVPMESNVKKILNVVVVIILILILLHAFGVIDELRGVRVPKL